MKTYKVTRGPRYDADATMAVLEPHYLLAGTEFMGGTGGTCSPNFWTGGT